MHQNHHLSDSAISHFIMFRWWYGDDNLPFFSIWLPTPNGFSPLGWHRHPTAWVAEASHHPSWKHQLLTKYWINIINCGMIWEKFDMSPCPKKKMILPLMADCSHVAYVSQFPLYHSLSSYMSPGDSPINIHEIPMKSPPSSSRLPSMRSTERVWHSCSSTAMESQRIPWKKGDGPRIFQWKTCFFVDSLQICGWKWLMTNVFIVSRSFSLWKYEVFDCHVWFQEGWWN